MHRISENPSTEGRSADQALCECTTHSGSTNNRAVRQISLELPKRGRKKYDSLTYKIGGLDKTEEESNRNQSAVALDPSGGGRDDTPENHGCGEIDGWLAHLIQEEVGRNYKPVSLLS